MDDPKEFDEVMPDLPEHGPLKPERIEENLWLRLVFMVLIAVMISLAQTVLTVATVLQFVITLLHRSEPNERLAEFGIDLGTWIAKAARYQTMASEEKPWPWTPFD